MQVPPRCVDWCGVSERAISSSRSDSRYSSSSSCSSSSSSSRSELLLLAALDQILDHHAISPRWRNNWTCHWISQSQPKIHNNVDKERAIWGNKQENIKGLLVPPRNSQKRLHRSQPLLQLVPQENITVKLARLEKIPNILEEFNPWKSQNICPSLGSPKTQLPVSFKIVSATSTHE